MNDRQTASRSQPRRSSTAIRPFWIFPERLKPFLALPVAKEKAVSRASETRVTEGCASLVEISCMAARPASQLGNR